MWQYSSAAGIHDEVPPLLITQRHFHAPVWRQGSGRSGRILNHGSRRCLGPARDRPPEQLTIAALRCIAIDPNAEEGRHTLLSLTLGRCCVALFCSGSVCFVTVRPVCPTYD